MMDKTLKQGILDYYEFEDKGMKKEAKDAIVEAMHHFDKLSEENKKEVAYECCAAMLMEEQNDLATLFSNHNLIPYELSSRLSEMIRTDYEQKKMPQMRWYYKLFLQAPEIIREAYYHLDRDERTAQDYFASLLHILYQGSQYLPKECLLDRKSYEETMEECRNVLENHSIENVWVEDFQRYQKVYDSWWESNA